MTYGEPVFSVTPQAVRTNANIDYCGARNLLRLLAGHGFTEAELKKIAVRVAQAMGADIIRGILKSEKHCGDVLMKKTYTQDCISKKQLRNEGQLNFSGKSRRKLTAKPPSTLRMRYAILRERFLQRRVTPMFGKRKKQIAPSYDKLTNLSAAGRRREQRSWLRSTCIALTTLMVLDFLPGTCAG